MYYDLVKMLDPPSAADKTHEDLHFPGPPSIFFHWLARFADHEELYDGTDARTGRLRYNATLIDLNARGGGGGVAGGSFFFCFNYL
jgi:hypothetical protein